MRENETRIGGLQWGIFSIFEGSSEPRTSRCIDQSVVAWRLASKAAGSAAFENPRSVIQRTVSMITGGSNREHRYSIQPLRSANERTWYNDNLGVPIIYCRRAMMTVGEVRARTVAEREANRQEGFRYPTVEEVAEIQRRFFSPELQSAMELSSREYLARMTRMISEPAPPGLYGSSTPGCNAD